MKVAGPACPRQRAESRKQEVEREGKTTLVGFKLGVGEGLTVYCQRTRFELHQQWEQTPEEVHLQYKSCT